MTTNIELNDKLITCIYKKQWILNTDLDKQNNERIDTEISTIELKDNYRVENLDRKKEFVSSKFNNLVIEKDSNILLPIIVYNLLQNTSINDIDINDFNSYNSKITQIILYLVKCKIIFSKYKEGGGFDLKNNLDIAEIYGPISIKTPPLSFFEERMLFLFGLGIEKFTFNLKILFFSNLFNTCLI